MDSKNKILVISVIVAFVLGSFGTYLLTKDKESLVVGGAPGSRTIESMLPGVQQAGGILSSKQMWINASTTLQGLVNIDGVLSAGGTVDFLDDFTVGTIDFIVDVSANAVSIGTTTPSDDKTFQVDGGTATGTISADSSTDELFGGCFEIKSMTASSTFFMVATTSGSAYWIAGSCIGGSFLE